MSRFTHLAIFHATKQLYQNLERGRKKKSKMGKSLGGREGTQRYYMSYLSSEAGCKLWKQSS